MAPHRTADNHTHFEHQSFLVGKYFSTAWYQLQLVLHTGNRSGVPLAPVDWNYQPNHIDNLYQQAGGPAHSFRLLHTYAVMIQEYTNGRGVQDFGIRQIHPARFAPGGLALGELERGTRSSRSFASKG